MVDNLVAAAFAGVDDQVRHPGAALAGGPGGERDAIAHDVGGRLRARGLGEVEFWRPVRPGDPQVAVRVEVDGIVQDDAGGVAEVERVLDPPGRRVLGVGGAEDIEDLGGRALGPFDGDDGAGSGRRGRGGR